MGSPMTIMEEKGFSIDMKDFHYLMILTFLFHCQLEKMEIRKS